MKELIGIVFFVTLFLLSCNSTDSKSKSGYRPTYITDTSQKHTELLVGFLPIHNPQLLHESFGPIVDYLNKYIPEVKFRFVASGSYRDFDDRLHAGYFDFALTNPYQALEAEKFNYTIFGKMSDDEKFKGVILVRKDSNIANLSDLKGKVVSFPAPTALAGTMMPLYYLHTHGLNVKKDIIPLYGISQESTIMNVYLGKSSAAAIWFQAWENFKTKQPVFSEKLDVKWETNSLVNNAWIARNDANKAILSKIQNLLFTMQDNEEGRKLLESILVSKFEKATNINYIPVAAFMKKYNSIFIHQK